MEHAAIQEMPGYIWNLNLLVQAVVPVTLIASAWAGVGRMELSRSEKTKTAGLISATTAAGLLFLVAWTRECFLRRTHADSANSIRASHFNQCRPRPDARNAATRRACQTRAAVMVRRIEVYRALGFVFLALWSLGQLPGEFAIPAGIGDVIVGASAPYVAWPNARRSASAERVTLAWNIFGIGDLIIAVTMGFLTSPSPLQMLAVDRPNLLITQYPLVMVPAFLVPASIILHGLSLWKLSHQPHLAGSAHHVPATNIA